MNRIKDNPIPTAIAGLGLWMLFRNDNSSDSEKNYKGSGRMASGSYPQGSARSSVQVFRRRSVRTV